MREIMRQIVAQDDTPATESVGRRDQTDRQEGVTAPGVGQSMSARMRRRADR